MKRIKTVMILVFIATIITVSCITEGNFQNGIVRNYSNPSVRGCGWVIEFNNAVYSPVNLDPVFQQDSLRVKVDYQLLNTSQICGFEPPGFRDIKITSIKWQ